ncbi:MAG: DUF1579 family protein [Phycisphaerales bacterium]
MRNSRSLSLFITCTLLCVSVLLTLGAALQDQDDAATSKDDRRNPRSLRADRGESQGPRMVAGAIELNEDPLREFERLEPMIGEFTFTGKSWQRPDAPANEYHGTWTNSWTLGGYYMQSLLTILDQRRRGEPYTSIGMMCYDAATRRYEVQQYNNTSSTRMIRSGSFDDDGPVLTMETRFNGQAADEPATSKVTFEIVSDDVFTYTGWQLTSDGVNWWKTFEITATRVGAESQQETSPSEEEEVIVDDDDGDGTV